MRGMIRIASALVALYNTLRALQKRLGDNSDIDNPVRAGASLTAKPAHQAQVKSLVDKLNEQLTQLAILEKVSCTTGQALRAWGKFFNHEFWGEPAEHSAP